MRAVDLRDNGNGTWTANIYGSTFTGSREECVAWLTAHGECPP